MEIALVGAQGKAGFFNQNSDARIAQYNLAQLYYAADTKLETALGLIEGVIQKSQGKPIFFCCEFAGGRSFLPTQFATLKSKIEQRLQQAQ